MDGNALTERLLRSVRGVQIVQGADGSVGERFESDTYRGCASKCSLTRDDAALTSKEEKKLREAIKIMKRLGDDTSALTRALMRHSS